MTNAVQLSPLRRLVWDSVKPAVLLVLGAATAAGGGAVFGLQVRDCALLAGASLAKGLSTVIFLRKVGPRLSRRVLSKLPEWSPKRERAVRKQAWLDLERRLSFSALSRALHRFANDHYSEDVHLTAEVLFGLYGARPHRREDALERALKSVAPKELRRVLEEFHDAASAIGESLVADVLAAAPGPRPFDITVGIGDAYPRVFRQQLSRAAAEWADIQLEQSGRAGRFVVEDDRFAAVFHYLPDAVRDGEPRLFWFAPPRPTKALPADPEGPSWDWP